MYFIKINFHSNYFNILYVQNAHIWNDITITQRAYSSEISLIETPRTGVGWEEINGNKWETVNWIGMKKKINY